MGKTLTPPKSFRAISRLALTFHLLSLSFLSCCLQGSACVDALLEKAADKLHIRAVVRRTATMSEFENMDVEVRADGAFSFFPFASLISEHYRPL
jgi:hypothetical protein